MISTKRTHLLKMYVLRSVLWMPLKRFNRAQRELGIWSEQISMEYLMMHPAERKAWFLKYGLGYLMMLFCEAILWAAVIFFAVTLPVHRAM